MQENSGDIEMAEDREQRLLREQRVWQETERSKSGRRERAGVSRIIRRMSSWERNELGC